MARIYAEEVERRKMQLGSEERGKQTSKIAVAGSEGSKEGPGSSSSPSAEQEVIVLRGGFTRWCVGRCVSVLVMLTFTFSGRQEKYKVIDTSASYK